MTTHQNGTKIFGSHIDRTMKIIRQHYMQAFRDLGVDITTEQWVIVDSLFHQDGQSQTELADGSFKNMATVSRIIDLTCQKGFTERFRSESDKRRYRVFLTKKGKEVYHKIKPTVDQLRQKGWKGLSDEDYDDFLRIMNTIFSNFKEAE
ncbi:MAG: MarR family transcriptional regulator [Saprospiraceae bacterium]|nr:MarR family transcriptional regulator [Saprospiraceae bacterium]